MPIGFGLLTCDNDGAGRGARRRRARQQGMGCGARRARDGRPLRPTGCRGRELRRARARACCRRCTRGTCAAASTLERVADADLGRSLRPARRAQARRRARAHASIDASGASSIASSPTSRRTGGSSASASSSAACCASAPPSCTSGETPPRVVIQEAVQLAERYGSAKSAQVRERRARRARAPHGADVSAASLLVNWQDRENPQAGGAEIHLHEIFGRLAATGHEVTLLCGGWPGCAAARDARRHRGASASARGTPSLSSRAATTSSISPARLRRARRGRQQGAALHAALGRDRTRRAGAAPVRRHGVPGARRAAGRRGLDRRAAARSRVSRLPFEAISESTADDLAARGIPRAARRGDLSRHRHRRATRRTPARAVADAGVRLSRAAEEVQGRAPRASGVRGDAASRRRTLEIAGAGDYRPALEALAASLDLGERVRFLGRISEAEKLALLRRSWALVFASPKEGWGITNLEAAACATPVVASNSPGIRESVRDGETGFLVPHGDRRDRGRAAAQSSSEPRAGRRVGRAGARVRRDVHVGARRGTDRGAPAARHRIEDS